MGPKRLRPSLNFRVVGCGLALTAWLAAPGLAGGARRAGESPKFKFVAGTENLERNCAGNLELSNEALTFRCPKGAVSIPYTSITFMQYRPNLGGKVGKMKIKWKVPPPAVAPILAGKKNRFFVVVYTQGGAAQALALEVSARAMQPYLAEIELKSDKRIEVYSHEEYN